MGIPYAEVIGDPVEHSKSPAIHKFWLEGLGLKGDYRARCVTKAELPAYFVDRRNDPDWRGCNVTMPLKRAVLPFMGRLDGMAEKCQAVNTIVAQQDRSRKGHNTDALAIERLMRRFGHRVYPNHVATYVQILGAGGAARAAASGAVAAGYGDFDFFNRSPEGARALAAWFGLNPDMFAHSLDVVGPIRNPGDGPGEQRYSQVIINATSLGMAGQDELAIDLSDYYPDTIVIDMVYRPAGETALARQARALGLRLADGLDVLIEQAAFAFELFFGAPAPREHDAELRERLTS
jgi:shikimate dehydrogenase